MQAWEMAAGQDKIPFEWGRGEVLLAPDIWGDTVCGVKFLLLMPFFTFEIAPKSAAKTLKTQKPRVDWPTHSASLS